MPNPAPKSRRGVFTAKAKRNKMGVQAFARKVLANKDDYSALTVKQANFARNFGSKAAVNKRKRTTAKRRK